MKKILTVAIACACLTGFSSCNDFLEEKPQSSLTAPDYYQTEAQAQANVDYLYRTGASNKLTGAGSAYVGPFASITGQLTGYFTNSYEGQELTCKYSRELTRQQNTMTVLTSVYMQQGKYADAASAVKTVIDSPHALATNNDLALGSAYNKIRTTDGLDESIYSYEYNATISNGGWWPTYAFNSAATAIFGTYSIFERTYGPTNQFLNVYAANDLRIQPNQFFHWDYTNPDNGKTWTAPKDACGCWFWYDEDALLNSGRSTKDRDIYRYAEALLDAAESIAQSQGVTAEAAVYLAQVKARANMEGKTVAAITADLQKLGKQAFIEECWTERLREFPLEFKIWDDCLRTGKFPVISSTEKGKVTYVDLVGAKNASGATFKSSDLLWPISLNEMQRNPSLTQNEGYAVQ